MEVHHQAEDISSEHFPFFILTRPFDFSYVRVVDKLVDELLHARAFTARLQLESSVVEAKMNYVIFSVGQVACERFETDSP